MCDGKIDCPDHSDEQHHICMKRNSVNKLQTQEINVGLKCPQPWFRCVDSSSCIAPHKKRTFQRNIHDHTDTYITSRMKERGGVPLSIFTMTAEENHGFCHSFLIFRRSYHSSS
ncbi:Protein CBG05913 [Caenorhabditis briggsae]|uniref:Protein CBG05913 n=1 Tax=Caenorhabditis briggsae TaxID=6238 RepID=A8X1C7_CAEBR|nr:Protein CBG05913 [Caenorhabditis briggsae]CAP26437.2 Protein CBG05913 [Caenorhabditis briggsae]